MDGDKIFEWIGIVFAYTFAVVVLLVSITQLSAIGIVLPIFYFGIYFWYFRARKLVKPLSKSNYRQKALLRCCSALEFGDTPVRLFGLYFIVASIIKLSQNGFYCWLEEVEQMPVIYSLILLIPIGFAVGCVFGSVMLLAYDDELE